MAHAWKLPSKTAPTRPNARKKVRGKKKQVGLLLNADKTVVPTNEAQPPPILATDGGLKLVILQRNVGQKWLGCMLAAEGSQSQHIDLEYHLQQALKCFYANRWI